MNVAVVRHGAKMPHAWQTITLRQEYPGDCRGHRCPRRTHILHDRCWCSHQSSYCCKHCRSRPYKYCYNHRRIQDQPFGSGSRSRFRRSCSYKTCKSPFLSVFGKIWRLPYLNPLRPIDIIVAQQGLCNLSAKCTYMHYKIIIYAIVSGVNRIDNRYIIFIIFWKFSI